MGTVIFLHFADGETKSTWLGNFAKRYSQGGVQVPTGGKARKRPFESQVSADQV